MPESTTLHYMIGNHLGSASVVMDDARTFVSETRYKPWGEVRYTTANKTLPTRYTFTGQYSYISDDATDLGAAGFGLMFYNARWYDPMTGRMAQADMIVPGGVQGLDRYAYVNNSPVRYIDPSGHESVCGYSYSDPECPPPASSGGGESSDSEGNGIDGTEDDFTCEGHGFNSEARDLCNNYIDLRDESDWWNGFQVGTFTLWDFINLILSMEFSGALGNISFKLLQQVVVRNFYKECHATQQCDSTSAIDVLMYLAQRHMGIAHDVSLPSMRNNLYATFNFASAFQKHEKSWENGCGNGNVPCEWANKLVDRSKVGSTFREQQFRTSIFTSLNATPLVGNDPSLDANSFYLQWGSGSTFFIATENQLNCAYNGWGANCSR